MKKAVVTGGGGFLGSAIVRMLRQEGIPVSVIGRNRYPQLEEIGASCLRGDVADRQFMERSLAGADVVFHVAALAGIWGTYQSYHRVNVSGSENVLQACLDNGIKVLVHTSTPSVVFASDDISGGDEDLPYPDAFLCGYAQTKAIAEKIILSQDQRQLRSCAIRPHLIWGPGDPHLLPRLIARGKKGDLKIVGNGTNMVDITFVENAAHAHLLAARSLLESDRAAGKAYFIGQERPVLLWEWINELFAGLGIAPVRTKVPFRTAYAIGAMCEGCSTLLGLKKEPKMTRFLALQLAKSHWFSHARARNDFGYQVRVGLEEGMARTLHWLKTT